MDATLTTDVMAKNDKLITDTVLREQARLRHFIRKRILDDHEVDDVLQDVLYEFVEVSRLPEPVEQIGAWLFRVARNRIIDRFRKKREVSLPDVSQAGEDEPGIEDLLPSQDAGPEAAYARSVLLSALHDALDELPAQQRDIFIAHELEHRSFKELAAESGVAVNTLLSRKRYAVLFLRKRLEAVHEEFDW